MQEKIRSVEVHKAINGPVGQSLAAPKRHVKKVVICDVDKARGLVSFPEQRQNALGLRRLSHEFELTVSCLFRPSK